MPDSNDIVFSSYGPDLVSALTKFLTHAAEDTGWLGTIMHWLATAWGIFTLISLIISALLIVGIIYSYIRFNQLSEVEQGQLDDAERLWRELYGDGGGSTDWDQIRRHIESENPNDWRLSIIEADIMLDRALTNLGYAGNTLGEKLKSISVQHVSSLQDAWDAHIIRNKIAHEGSDFVLTHRLAREAITKYQRVLSELGVL